MKLSIFFIFRKYALSNLLVLPLVMLCNTNVAIADSLTYSPDQWPRNWNQSIMEMHQNQGFNSRNQYKDFKPSRNNSTRREPTRSSAWGAPPNAKKKSRRSTRPEYNTSSPGLNYYQRPNIGYNPYYPGMAGFGASPFAAPILVPGISPLLAPGLTSPGIPLSVHPFVGYPHTPRYMGIMPGMVY